MIDLDEVIASHGAGDPWRYVVIADQFLVREDRAAAAVALDRAFGLAPDDVDLARHRAAILEELTVREHGLTWRYIPAGTFMMGSDRGDPDERPVHPRTLDAFWISDAPITWARYCALLGWAPPPDGSPPALGEMALQERLGYAMLTQIRYRYCRAAIERPADGDSGVAARSDRSARYDFLPMVAVTIREAEQLAEQLTRLGPAQYQLPTEAQWEKAARGGLVGARYAWGDAPPAPTTCDCERMGDFRLLDPRSLPANGYGLHGMCGGVAEWTADAYDALAYHRAATGDMSPSPASEPERVLRGGAWTDCAAAVTVSYRMSRRHVHSPSPTIGFRLVRTAPQVT